MLFGTQITRHDKKMAVSGLTAVLVMTLLSSAIILTPANAATDQTDGELEIGILNFMILRIVLGVLFRITVMGRAGFIRPRFCGEISYVVMWMRLVSDRNKICCSSLMEGRITLH
ncbi:hypothetical protein QQ045_018774 [Rhodiola kirilowii]